MAARPLFELEHIVKVFPVESEDVIVLRDVSVTINQGDFVCIFGPSGCGKTTLLNTLTGLEPPTNGAVKYLGFDLTSASEDQFTELRKNNVGMLYQQQHWVHSLNVLDNVAFALNLHGISQKEARERAMQKLKEVGMENWAYFRPNRLSAGQQQRVGLARALMTDPSVVIADEPTGNLDLRSGEELMQILVNLHKQGKTLVMVTHNIDHLAYVSRIVHMIDGQIVQEFSTDKLNLQAIKDTLNKIKSVPANKLPNYTGGLPDKKKKRRWWNPITGIARLITSSVTYLLLCITFLILIGTYWFTQILHWLFHWRWVPSFIRNGVNWLWNGVYNFIINTFDRGKLPTVRRIYLIDLSLHSLRNKLVRSLVTIGGMAVGIGAIVFLVSIGYGLERLVLDRVTRLNEIEHIEVSALTDEQHPLSPEAVKAIRDIEHVSNVLPLISVAGRVTNAESRADIVVFGAQTSYFRSSTIPLSAGGFYQNNELHPAPALLTADEQAAAPHNDDGSIIANLSVGQTRQTVINESMAALLGGTPREAINKKITVSFVVTGPLVQNKYKLVSSSLEYTVVGVVSEGDSPYMYVPIVDLQEMGLPYFSQATVVVDDQSNVTAIRQKIEVLGFQTTSIIDTIRQIQSLFSTIRLVLILIGTAALLVAAFGMFNTLTVSLLERTKEIGLMKSLGMKSGEVKELFLTESMQMGLMGGVLGLLLGFVGGQALSLILTGFSLLKGQGYLGVTTIPWYFSVVIIVFSVLVGITTGIYPSQRAARISALQALLNE